MNKEKKEENLIEKEKNRTKELEALLAVLIHIHFSNAVAVQMFDKEIFKKSFAKFNDDNLIAALSIFANKIPMENAQELLNGINPYRLLNITKSELEEFFKKCRNQIK